MTTPEFVAIGSTLRWTDSTPTFPERPAWQAEGACNGCDPDVFFPERGEDQAAAKAVCHGCPVRAECLEYAIANNDDGIWGGTSKRERNQIRRDRGIDGRAASTIVVDAARRRDLAIALRAAGLHVHEIAAALDVSRRVVHRYLDEAS